MTWWKRYLGGINKGDLGSRSLPRRIKTPSMTYDYQTQW